MSGRDAHQQQVQQVVVPKHATITPEEGGLHIGGVVILPSQSGRRGVSAAVTHDGSAGGAAAATNDHINWTSSAGGGRSTNDESDDSGSMDQDLLDYMINLIEVQCLHALLLCCCRPIPRSLLHSHELTDTLPSLSLMPVLVTCSKQAVQPVVVIAVVPATGMVAPVTMMLSLTGLQWMLAPQQIAHVRMNTRAGKAWGGPAV